MSKQSVNTALASQMDQQELHHLITVSTGFIDAYVIECDQLEPMLLPQNIVLSAIDAQTGVKQIEWHDLNLPVYAVNSAADQHGVALVIEGEDIHQRFALMCRTMPTSIRLRISEVVDEDQDVQNPVIFKYVRMGEQRYHVPNMQYIQSQLGL